MIQLWCECGTQREAAESEAGQSLACDGCGRIIRLVCAEELPEGAGAADFDARLVVQAGPQLAGTAFLLGGVAGIEIGKLADKHIHLPGTQVSRAHCKLTRVDFGPSRWRIEDNNSRNGLLVNGERVTGHDLQSGDVITVGEFKLTYQVREPEPPLPPAMPAVSVAATAIAAPPATRPRRTKTLAYATPQDSEERLLADSDPNWVIRLRNASSLMVMAIFIMFASRFFAVRWIPGVESIVAAATSLLTCAGAWYLTCAEPGAPEKVFWTIVRITLRVVATMGTAGELLVVAGQETENQSLVLAGLGLSLAKIGQFFLLLLYLNKLARRIPSPALAVNALIVMIGLPVSLTLVLVGVFMALNGGAAGASLAYGAGGACSAFIFALWYCGLLIWFNKSFS